MVHCREKAGKRYGGILEAPERFMVRWREAVTDLSRQRRASAVDGVRGHEGGGGDRRSGRKPDEGNAEMERNRRSRRETAEDESRKEMADKLARHQAD